MAGRIPGTWGVRGPVCYNDQIRGELFWKEEGARWLGVRERGFRAGEQKGTTKPGTPTPMRDFFLAQSTDFFPDCIFLEIFFILPSRLRSAKADRGSPVLLAVNNEEFCLCCEKDCGKRRPSLCLKVICQPISCALIDLNVKVESQALPCL